MPKVKADIGKLIREYKKNGTITTSRASYKPKSMKNALAIANAIEYGKAREARKKK